MCLVQQTLKFVIPIGARNLPYATKAKICHSERSEESAFSFFQRYLITSFRHSRLPLPVRNSQARYAIVRWHRFSRTNHTRHSERGEESLFSARGKGRHAQAPKQGAEEKWQSAPYL